MVKHTQTIRRQQPTNCFSIFDHFAGLVVKARAIVKGYSKDIVQGYSHYCNSLTHLKQDLN